MLKRVLSFLLVFSCLSVSCINYVSAEAADAKLINEIKVIDFVAPVEGESYFNQKLSIPDDANYKIQGVFWDAPFVFEADKTYKLTIGFTAKEGYKFDDASKIKATINGKAVEKTEIKNEILYISSNFKIKKSNIVYLVKVTNVNRSEAGKNASVKDFKYTESEKYKFSDVYWYNETEQKKLAENDVFKAKNEYSAVFEAALSGSEYKFADDSCLRAHINDKPVQYEHIGDKKIKFKLSFEALKENEIDYAEMSIPAPKLGQKPEDIKITIPDNANYSIVDVKWYDSNNNEIEKGEVFEKTYSIIGNIAIAKEYYFTVSVTLKTKDGVLFAKEGLSAKVNGQSASIYFVEEDDFEDDPRDRSLVYVVYKFVFKENAKGDVNCDGLVTMEDVTTLQKIIAKLESHEKYGESSKEKSDCDKNGEINMADVVMIQKHIAKLITLF